MQPLNTDNLHNLDVEKL